MEAGRSQESFKSRTAAYFIDFFVKNENSSSLMMFSLQVITTMLIITDINLSQSNI